MNLAMGLDMEATVLKKSAIDPNHGRLNARDKNQESLGSEMYFVTLQHLSDPGRDVGFVIEFSQNQQAF